MKTTYEISYNSNVNGKSGEALTPAQAINSTLSTIYDGLHHRGLFIENGYSVDQNQIESNSITLKLFDLKYQYLLNFKVLKSDTPTQILIELEEMFQRPAELIETELIQIRKTYEILKDSFLFSKNIKLHSETTNSKLENYYNRIFEPKQCQEPLKAINSVNWTNIENLENSITITRQKHLKSNFNEITIKAIGKGKIDSPVMFWLNHRGRKFYEQFDDYKYDIQNYTFRHSDLIGNCLNLTKNQIKELESRMADYNKIIKIENGMWMGTDGYTDEYFMQTKDEYMILVFN